MYSNTTASSPYPPASYALPELPAAAAAAAADGPASSADAGKQATPHVFLGQLLHAAAAPSTGGFAGCALRRRGGRGAALA